MHRMTVDEYHELIDGGTLDDLRGELIHVWIFESMTPKPPHSNHVRRLIRHLLPLLSAEDYVVGVQDAITLSDSEPQPDFLVATGPEEKYAERHPGPKDLVLVVEVSHMTVRHDRVTKLRLYAKEGISQYWIVDVKARRIEVYTQPHGGKKPGYRKQAVYKPVDDRRVVVGGKVLSKIPAAKLLP